MRYLKGRRRGQAPRLRKDRRSGTPKLRNGWTVVNRRRICRFLGLRVVGFYNPTERFEQGRDVVGR